MSIRLGRCRLSGLDRDRRLSDRVEDVVAAEVGRGRHVEGERLPRGGLAARFVDQLLDGERASGVETGVDGVVVVTWWSDIDRRLARCRDPGWSRC